LIAEALNGFEDIYRAEQLIASKSRIESRFSWRLQSRIDSRVEQWKSGTGKTGQRSIPTSEKSPMMASTVANRRRSQDEPSNTK
jgi:hypothetical protein